MTHDVEAIYDHGVFRPTEPLTLPEGARVRLRVEEENGTIQVTTGPSADKANPGMNYESWLDDISGRWHGEFLRGGEGDFESREPMS
jgi:predicted DNA-binding antitoxin AbrB/MazE fold protein